MFELSSIFYPESRHNERTFKRTGLSFLPRGGPRLRDAQGHVNGVGGRVRERRNALGLTQAQLCARVQVATDGAWPLDRQDVLRIENGGRLVGDLELICLALVLEVTARWLLLGDADDVARRWMP